MYPHEAQFLLRTESKAAAARRGAPASPVRPSADSTGTTGPVAFGRRIVVTGKAGAGKSTLARALAERTGLPVIHLDLHFWKPGWVEPSEAEWRATQRTVLAGDEWIAEGNYHQTLDLRLERASDLVMLDLPWWLCVVRALRRGLHLPDTLPTGCHYSAWQRLRDEWLLAGRIWWNRRTEPAREYATIAAHGQHVRLHVLRSRREVRRFFYDLDHADPGGG